jgi:hypothetical protein
MQGTSLLGVSFACLSHCAGAAAALALGTAASPSPTAAQVSTTHQRGRRNPRRFGMRPSPSGNVTEPQRRAAEGDNGTSRRETSAASRPPILMPHAAPDSDEVARCYVCHRRPEKDLTPLTSTDSGGSRPDRTSCVPRCRRIPQAPRCAAALARWWHSVTWRTAYVLGFRLTAISVERKQNVSGFALRKCQLACDRVGHSR